MSAESLAAALGGKRIGKCWMARCPCHHDQTPSLSIEDKGGTVVVHCHAGCAQRDVIRTLLNRGLWSSRGNRTRSNDTNLSATSAVGKSNTALARWKAAFSGEGRPVETYLRKRNICLPIPDALRFHPKMFYPGYDKLPAMVALVVNARSGTPQAIHRTFLARDGIGKACVPVPKKMLGPCAGGVVRLAPIGSTLLVGEGIETTLSAMQRFGLPGWATLSAPGLAKFRAPGEVKQLVVAADGDDAGRRAAQDCARRAQRDGVTVWIAAAPEGQDWNDVIMGRPLNGGGA